MLGIGKKKMTPEQEADGLGFTFDKALNFFKAIPQNVSDKVHSGAERMSQFFKDGGSNIRDNFGSFAQAFQEMLNGKNQGQGMEMEA